MKEKKQEGIGTVIILIIVLLVLTIVGTIIYAKFFISKKVPEVSSKDIAAALHEQNPNQSVKELTEIGNTQLTSTQQQVVDVVFANTPVMDEVVEDDTLGENVIKFTDVDGNEWTTELDEEILNLSDEEAEAMIEQMYEEMRQELANYKQFDGEVIVSEPSIAEDEEFDNWDSEDGFDGVYTGDEGITYDKESLANSGLDFGGPKRVIDPTEGKTQEQIDQEVQEMLERTKDDHFYGG